VLAVEAGKGSARLNTVLSTRLTLLSLAPIEGQAPARKPDADVAPAPAHRHSDPTSILREGPLEQTSAPPAPKAPPPPAPAGGPAAGAPAAGLPNGRIFSVLENIKTAGANTVRVNVFLNHPNPTAATPESDPHFVGTFGLFGLRSHAAHSGMSVQLELTRTIANLRRLNMPVGGQFDIQLIPVGGQGSAPEVMNPERIRILTM
jgi:tyrosinase